MSAAAAGAHFLADSLDWSGRSRRGAFILAWAVWLALVLPLLIRPGLLAGGWRWILVPAAAFWLFPLVGHSVRRAHDIGRSGWWVWTMAVPGLGFLPVAWLALRRSASRGRSGSLFSVPGPALVAVIALALLARTVWTPLVVTSGDMKPALLVGDVALYLRGTRPERGDLVAIAHGGETIVRRVIGLPGDRVALVDGRVEIGGVPATLTQQGLFAETMGPQGPHRELPRCLGGAVGFGGVCEKRRLEEVLPGGARHPILDIGPRPTDNEPPILVPEGQYYVLGDNRDHATDSRLGRGAGGLGLIGAEAVVGRVTRVLVSAAGPSPLQVWTWRSGRFLERVR